VLVVVFHRSDGGAAGHNGPLEARFLMNGMLRSWDAILDAWFRALSVGCRKFVINSGPFREKVVVFEVACKPPVLIDKIACTPAAEILSARQKRTPPVWGVCGARMAER
jgi:hypothetical protein